MWKCTLLDPCPEGVEKQTMAQWVQILSEEAIGETRRCLLLPLITLRDKPLQSGQGQKIVLLF